MRPRLITGRPFLHRVNRRGAVVALVGLLLPVMVGFTAISVDLTVLAAGRSQMQTTTDAAALAAARQLVSDRRLQGATSLSTELTNAHAQMLAIGQENPVLGSAPIFEYTSGNPSGADVLIGYLDPKDLSHTSPDATAAQSTFNSVQVFGRRDSSHGGGVPSFFGGIFGKKGYDFSVSSVATAQPFEIAGFTPTNNLNAHLLPIVLNIENYKDMLAGNTTDDFSYDPATGAVAKGADGVKESVLYPIRSGSPGNWGTIKVGVSDNSTSTLGSQIRYGITPGQMTTAFPPDGDISLDQVDYSTTPATSYHTFEGNPGISSGIKDDLTAIMGRPVVIPIYDNNGGNGNNAWYRVVDFAAVRIVNVDFKGNPKYVVVQPAYSFDPTIVKGEAKETWTEGGAIGLYLSR
jgi:Flp pilus assembly protein TadG